MSNSSRVNWPVRIILCILWPIGWLFLLGVVQWILSGIRASMVQVAKQGVNALTVADTYGVIKAIVMLGATLLLPSVFVFIIRKTRKKPSSPSQIGTEDGVIPAIK